MANRVLVIGYGNPGRLDDGLGPALAEAVQRLCLAGVTTDADYQLTVEDAELVARHAFVIFADAAVRGSEPFALRAVRPSTEASFSTHSVEPGAVLTLARDLFGGNPLAYSLAIRGYAFDGFGEELTPRAQRNLAAAVAFMKDAVKGGEFIPARSLDPELEPLASGSRTQRGATAAVEGSVAPHCVREHMRDACETTSTDGPRGCLPACVLARAGGPSQSTETAHSRNGRDGCLAVRLGFAETNANRLN